MGLFKDLFSLKSMTEKIKAQSTTPKQMTETEGRNALHTHPIFYEIRSFNDVFSDTVPVDDPVKRRVAVAFLHILWKTTDEICSNIVENYEMYASNILELNAMITERTRKINTTALEEGIPTIFLDKMNARMTEDLRTLTRTLTDLHTVHNYNNSVEEILAILDVMLLHTRHNYSAIVGIINVMNGELHRALEGSVFDQ